jgi:choline-sulfatase
MPIYLQDAMATALDIADVEKPAHVEFNSVLPLIEGKKKVQYEEIYGKYIDNQRMIAKGDYKLIMYPKAQVTRLFNTTKDPDEMNDLAMNPEYAVTMAKLKANFLELQKSMGDTLDVDKPGAKKKIKKSKK